MCTNHRNWFGHNRSRLHHRARSGSGGVGIFVSHRLLKSFSCERLDNSHEGILWIKLIDKLNPFNIFTLAVCYLPPANSSRYVDVQSFFDNLLCNVYSFQGIGPFFIMGDFNARCGNSCDYIEGVDDICERQVIDFVKNVQGEHLIQFLLSANCCILNGRNSCLNDFTSVSTKGLSVVDYVLVPYEHLNYFNRFSVMRSSSLFSQFVSFIDPTRTLPDHSCLSWFFDTGIYFNNSISHIEENDTFMKFDLSHIPQDFLNDFDSLQVLNLLTQTLQRSQLSVNDVYNNFCDFIKGKMIEVVPHKNILVSQKPFGCRSEKRKPWWSNELSDKWRDLHLAEKLWCGCRNPVDKSNAKSQMKEAQRSFDRSVQSAKRKFWYEQQQKIQHLESNNPILFWQQVNKLGIGNDRNQYIPWEVVLEDGSISYDKSVIFETWQKYFANLFCCDTPLQSPESSDMTVIECDNSGYCSLNDPISIDEVYMILNHAKTGKAVGFDGIPVEVLKNVNCAKWLHTLFSLCFNNCFIPDLWKRGIICPILKSCNSDKRIPNNYRGITLISSICKLFCGVLNQRLSKWCNDLDIIVDEQNGFRKDRCCLDHLTTLSSIIDIRKKSKKSTFCAFLDFSKAYDHIPRDLLWSKLHDLGIKGNFLKCLIAMYANVSCCLRINGKLSGWFPVDIGLKQGCILSPLLFSLYINDLVKEIKDLDIGVPISGTEKISILLYADDVVLIAENAENLQTILHTFFRWCAKWKLDVGESKSQIVHFRNPSVPCSTWKFSCGHLHLKTVSHYKYLGIIMDEFLTFNLATKTLADHASRALGALIAKFKSLGGLPFKVFTKLFDSLVLPILTYGAAVWGFRSFSCIDAVYNRACRFYLGVGRYAPNIGVQGDMGWTSPWHRQWMCIFRNFSRLCKMTNDRISRRVFCWAFQSSVSKKNWISNVHSLLEKVRMPHLFDVNCVFLPRDLKVLDSVLFSEFESSWFENLSRDVVHEGRGRNKLRTYRNFKNVYETEMYVKKLLPRAERSALAKFRLGVAPIAIETGRYFGVPENERVCCFCNMGVTESELHVLLECQQYSDLRNVLFTSISAQIVNFCNLSKIEQLSIILSDSRFVYITAKTCKLILSRRNDLNARD